MPDTATKLLIADFHGSFGPGCASRAVFGQIWLRRHGDLLVVYWEAQTAFVDQAGTLETQSDYFAFGGGYVAQNNGPTRWQTLVVVPADRRQPELADLAAVFADESRWEALLRAGLNAAMGEMYVPLRRCIFQLYSYQWQCRSERPV
jgi:hypothetical protein